MASFTPTLKALWGNSRSTITDSSTLVACCNRSSGCRERAVLAFLDDLLACSSKSRRFCCRLCLFSSCSSTLRPEAQLGHSNRTPCFWQAVCSLLSALSSNSLSCSELTVWPELFEPNAKHMKLLLISLHVFKR